MSYQLNSAVVKKWAPVLEKWGLSEQKQWVAQLLENQSAMGNGNALMEEASTTTASISDFTRFALPLLKKSFPNLISDELVGVQPMSQPAALVFYLRYRYGTTKGQTVAGTQIMRQNTGSNFDRYNNWAMDPYYSSQYVKDEAMTAVSSNESASVAVAHTPVIAGSVKVNIYDDSGTTDCTGQDPVVVVIYGPSGTVDAVIGEDTSGVGFTVDTTTSTFDSATAEVSVAAATGSFSGYTITADYEYDLEDNPNLPKLSLSIDSDTVAARTRKLKVSWSLEAAQDLKAVHNIDAERVLSDVMADEITAEIDREILNDLIVFAGIRASHNFGTAAGSSVNFTDRNIALLYKTLEVANIIHRTTLRGPANWIVTSSDISSKYEQINDFRADNALGDGGYNIGVVKAGSLSNKLSVYKDPLFPRCKVLMGYKGGNAMDTGYVYCPYIPLLSTPTIMDPNSFVPNKGILTRYGKKALEDGQYWFGLINVSNL